MMETTATRPHSGTSLTERPPVQITSEPGIIRIDAPALFAEGERSVIHRLVERLLQVDPVETIDIHHAESAVVVAYNRRRLGQAVALSKISAALQEDTSRRAGVATAGVDLDRIVGRVIRIERRRHRGGVLTTVISAGADLLSALAPKLSRAGRNGAFRNGHAEGKVVIRDGLAIRYVPLQVDRVENDSDQRGDNSRRLAPVTPTVVERIERPTIIVAQGWRRAANLAAAGGCFFMSFVGLVTPGIPTVPFVLATSYFLVRSSPALDERLRRSRLFGRMVRDWTKYGGMRPSTKLRVVLLTLAIMGGTLFIVEPTGPILILMGVMGTLGVVLILWTPGVPEGAPDDTTALLPE